MDNWKTAIEKLLQTETNKVVKLNLEKKSIEYTDKIKNHRDEKVITGDEEIVKAFLLQRLVNQLDYKPELIEKEKEYPSGRPKTTKPRIDYILRDDKGKAFFFIEAKAPEKFEGDKWMIDGQLFALAVQETKGVKYLVYYTADYQEGKLIDKALIIDFEKFKNYEDWDNAGRPSLADKLSPGYNKPQKPPLKKGDPLNDLRTSINRDDINSLASNLHNVLWGGGGTSDTEIFYSLVNIILAKIQDESEKEDDEEYDFQVYSYGENIESPEKVFERITTLFKTALKDKLNILDGKEISEARLIDRNKFPLNKLVYTVQSLEHYSFLEGRSSLDGRDILGDFFERITRDGFKQTKGQFFTPTPVVKFLFYALQIDRLSIDRLNKDRELPYIIDPSVGSGTFLVEAMKIVTKEIKYKQRDKLSSSRQVKDRLEELFKPDNKENRWARDYMYGSDINFDLGTASKVNMILHGDGSTNIFVKDGLLPFRFYDKDTAPNYLKIYQPDKLYKDKEVNGKFDVVVSNPPFSVNLDNETKRYLNHSFLFGDKKNSENLFIERWYQLLKENGRVAVVLPESVFDTTDNKYIRLFLFKYFNIKAVVSLPVLTFEPYTSTKTSLLFAQKKTAKEVELWNELWDKYGKEWGLLKTRVNDYIQFFVKENELNKKWAKDVVEDIEKENWANIKKNISWLLKNHLIEEDKTLEIKELLTKYLVELAELLQYDNDTCEEFGYYNAWWVFSEVAKKNNYPIFMADAENVGYKRTKRGQREMPNDLYDIEFAPNTINMQEIIDEYNENIKRQEVIEKGLKDDLIVAEKKNKEKSSKAFEKKIEDRNEDLEKCQSIIKQLTTDKDDCERIIKTYYTKEGKLKEEFYERTDPTLVSHFSTGLLKNKKSDDILLRKTEVIKILDAIRKEIVWN